MQDGRARLTPFGRLPLVERVECLGWSVARARVAEVVPKSKNRRLSPSSSRILFPPMTPAPTKRLMVGVGSNLSRQVLRRSRATAVYFMERWASTKTTMFEAAR